MKNRLVILFGGVLMLFGIFLIIRGISSRQARLEMGQPERTVASSAQSTGNSQVINEDLSTKNATLGSFVQEDNVKYVDHKMFFKEYFMKNKSVAEVYRSSIDVLGQNPESELVAEYFAEGIAREDSEQFAKYFHDLMTDINQGSQSVSRLLLEKEVELQKEKFIYQMALNLAFAMDIPTHVKARLLGGGLLMPIKLNRDGSIDVNSTNTTNAMILMKASKLPQRMTYSYLKQGLDVNKKDKASLQEYQSRANAYFPDMIDRPVIK